MEAEIVPFDESTPEWEQACYAFLAEMQRRNGSRRTVDAYSRSLQRFFGGLDKTPDQISERDVFAFAYGAVHPGRSQPPQRLGHTYRRSAASTDS